MTPDEFTNEEFFLKVGEGHTIYVQDWGNPTAKLPIIFLHGGPGNGCEDRDKQKFDPEAERVIFHDQRGSGKSTPSGSIEHNTTQRLIDDITKIAERCHLDTFVLVGGSWGSTLALAYAIEQPHSVAGLVLDGVFTASQAEFDWFDQAGWRQFYPDIWQEYQATVPANQLTHPTIYHLQHAFAKDKEQAKQSVYAYMKMELALLKLDDIYLPAKYDDFDPVSGLIEMHYMVNKCFLPEDHILEQASQLSMPVRIIQGRYDMVCPPQTAYQLHQALPDSQLVWTVNGHINQHEAKNIQKIFISQLTDHHG